MEANTIEPITQLVFSVEDGESAHETQILVRTDSWKDIQYLDEPAAADSAGSEAPTDEELQRLGDVLRLGGSQFEIVEAVHAFFQRSGARVMRISAKRRGQSQTTTVGFIVERGDGVALKVTPLVDEAVGVAQQEDTLSGQGQQVEQTLGPDEASDEAIEDQNPQAEKPRSTWKRRVR